MKSLIHLVAVLLLAIQLEGAEENSSSQVETVSFQANDWYSKYDFRVLKIEGNRKIEDVVVFFGGRYKPKNVLETESWQEFSKTHNIGLVSLDYAYQSVRKSKKGEKLRPLYKGNPEKASQLLEQELYKQIKKQFPNVRNYGFVGELKACTQSLRAGKKSCFWVAQNTAWKAPDKPYKQSMGLSVCSSKRSFSKLLESQAFNRGKKRRVTFLHEMEQDRDQVDSFIRQYIIKAFEDRDTKGKAVDLLSEELVTLVRKKEDRMKTTWLPDMELFEGWKDVHAMQKKDQLDKIYKEVVETEVKAQPHLNLYLKLPSQDGKLITPKGVMCIATWQAAEQSMFNLLRHKSFKVDLIEWAEKHQFAVVTWNTSTLWKSGTSQDELDKDNARAMDNRFDEIASAWKKGMRRLANKHGLPQNGYFIYGISRGSHWGHRLVLRNPDWFQAAHFHVANSYDIPTDNAKNLLWLITTGERDSGYQASMRFYEKCKNLGYPMTIKVGAGLGHADREDIIKISQAFFDYAHDLREKSKSDSRHPELQSELMADQMRKDLRASEYVGDLINQGVYLVKDAQWIPAGQKIPMATKDMSEAWGELQK